MHYHSLCRSANLSKQFRIVFYDIVGAFSLPYLLLQPPLQSPRTIPSSTSVNFWLHVSPPYLLTHQHSLCSTAIFHLCISSCSHSYNPRQKSFFLPWSLSHFRLYQGSREKWANEFCLYWDCLISPGFSDLWTGITAVTDNYWYFIAQAHNIGILQIVTSEDVCDKNNKLSAPPIPIPSIYYHYFTVLLIPSQDLICSWKPMSNSNNFQQKFATHILLMPHPYIKYLEILPSCPRL